MSKLAQVAKHLSASQITEECSAQLRIRPKIFQERLKVSADSFMGYFLILAQSVGSCNCWARHTGHPSSPSRLASVDIANLVVEAMNCLILK